MLAFGSSRKNRLTACPGFIQGINLRVNQCVNQCGPAWPDEMVRSSAIAAVYSVNACTVQVFCTVYRDFGFVPGCDSRAQCAL